VRAQSSLWPGASGASDANERPWRWETRTLCQAASTAARWRSSSPATHTPARIAGVADCKRIRCTRRGPSSPARVSRSSGSSRALLQGLEPPLHRRTVVTIAPAAYRADHAVVLALPPIVLAAIPRASVAMQNETARRTTLAALTIAKSATDRCRSLRSLIARTATSLEPCAQQRGPAPTPGAIAAARHLEPFAHHRNRCSTLSMCIDDGIPHSASCANYAPALLRITRATFSRAHSAGNRAGRRPMCWPSPHELPYPRHFCDTTPCPTTTVTDSARNSADHRRFGIPCD
jgi:hypothetical protein